MHALVATEEHAMTSVDVAREIETGRDEEQQIRQAIEDFGAAVRARDVDGILSFYAEDLVAFDMMPPLKFEGRDAYRNSWEQGLQMMQGPLEFEVSNLNIAVDGNVAYAHSLNRMAFTTSDGERMDGWMRWTGCFKKIDGKWLVAHEHNSVPLDMNSGKGLMDLKP